MDFFDIDGFLDKTFQKCFNKTDKLPNTVLFNNTIDATVYDQLNINNNINTTVDNVIKPMFPNDTVFNNEFNADKVFVLDKFNNNNNTRNNSNKCKYNFTKHLTYNINKLNLKFDSFLYMNKLWCEYINNLLNNTNNLDIINNKLLKCDLHGCCMEVYDSVNKTLVGIKGICIFESKKTFNLLSVDNKLRTILKKGTIFLINLPYGNYSTKIIGDNFIYRSAERTKTKFKNKYNLNLNLYNM